LWKNMGKPKPLIMLVGEVLLARQLLRLEYFVGGLLLLREQNAYNACDANDQAVPSRQPPTSPRRGGRSTALTKPMVV
jgi:hypothetical protein